MAKTDVTDDAAREEILRVALGLYRKSGPQSVTMDDVAAATGRSRTSLYYYFKNRDEIYHAVLDLMVKDVAGALGSAVSAQITLNDKVYAFCMAKLTTAETWKPIFKAMWRSMNADEQSKHWRGMNALHKKLIFQEGMIIKQMLSEAIMQHEIRAIDVSEQDLLAFIISSGIRGIRNEIIDQADPHDLKNAVRMLADMVISWLKG